MRSSRFGVLLLVAFATLAVLAGGVAYAQEQVGAIEGVVTDKDGANLPGVTVEAKSAAGQALVSVTDLNGEYRFPRLLTGVYKLTAKLDGFVTSEATGVNLLLGKTLKVNFTLQPGTFQDTITVAADTVAIDVTKSATATSISRESLELLPKGRDFSSVVGEAAGASNEAFLGGISIDGASGSENRFVIDGTDVTHPQDGVQGQPQIMDFVEEVQVKSAGYAAEYGGSLGGVINAITKTGSNDFHGTVGAYYTDSSWSGSVRGVRYEKNCASGGDCLAFYPKDDVTRLEPGFTIGGPIMRDKMWFYAGYQPALIDTTRTPWVSSNNQVPGDKSFDQTARIQYYTGNIKGNIGSSFLYKLAVNNAGGKTDGVLPASDGSTPAGSDLTTYNKYPRSSWSLYGDFIPTANFLVGARVGYFTTDSKISAPFTNTNGNVFYRNGDYCTQKYPGDSGAQATCRTSDPNYHAAGYQSMASNSATDKDKWDRESAGVDASVFFNAAGSHAVKFGFQYEKIKNKVDSGEAYNLYTFRWGLPDRFGYGVKGTAGSLGVRRFRTSGGAESTNNGLFVQDSWSILKNLTINLGVRTEQERVPNYGYAADPTLPKYAIEFNYQDKLAPRIGFAWDVMNDQKLKVYGSFGDYYDITKLEMPRGSFGGDKWIEYLWPLNTFDVGSLHLDQCSQSDNVQSVNPCPQLGAPQRSSDLRAPTNPYDAIDPGLKPMQNREYQVGADYQLTNKSVLGFRYVNKKLINTIEDIGYLQCDATGACQEVYTTGNPGKGIVAGDPDGAGPIPPQAEAKRDYEAFELSWHRRFADNWQLGVDYVRSNLDGNYSGLASSDEFGRTDPNVARYFDGLVYGYTDQGQLQYGPLNTDRPDALQVSGIYRFSFGTSVGVFTSWRSGTPVTTTAYYNGVDFMPEDRGDLGRTPDLTQTDLFISHQFKIGSFAVELNLNVTNLFDEKATTRIYNYPWRTDVCDHSDACDGSNEWYFGSLVPYKIYDFMGAPDDPYYKKAVNFQGARDVRIGAKFIF
jgi:hypothetical protein